MSESKQGKFVGNCDHCGLMLAEFDKVDNKDRVYFCPRCGKNNMADEAPNGKA